MGRYFIFRGYKRIVIRIDKLEKYLSFFKEAVE